MTWDISHMFRPQIRNPRSVVGVDATEKELEMEITKMGRDPATAVLKGTCTNCKTEVKFNKQEATQEWDRQIPLYMVKCPVCGHQICGVANK